MWYWWYNNYLVFLQTNKRRSNYLIFIGAAKQCSSPAGFLGEAKKLENLMDLIWHVLPACPPAQLILKSFSFSSLSPYLSRANPNSITLFSSSSSLLNELKPNMFNFPTNQMKRFKLFKLLILSDDDGTSNMLTRLRFMSVCSLNRKGKKKSALCLVGWLVGWLVGCQKSAVFIMPSTQSFENPVTVPYTRNKIFLITLTASLLALSSMQILSSADKLCVLVFYL